MKLNIIAIAHHRNGICGEPFHVAVFDEDRASHPEDPGRKVGIVFDQPHHCAVLDIAKLAAVGIGQDGYHFFGPVGASSSVAA